MAARSRRGIELSGERQQKVARTFAFKAAAQKGGSLLHLSWPNGPLPQASTLPPLVTQRQHCLHRLQFVGVAQGLRGSGYFQVGAVEVYWMRCSSAGPDDTRRVLQLLIAKGPQPPALRWQRCRYTPRIAMRDYCIKGRLDPLHLSSISTTSKRHGGGDVASGSGARQR